MSFDWKLYIQLADELINYQKTVSLQEAYSRSAVSRSYYGVFCIARNFLIRNGISIRPIDTHKFVREHYIGRPTQDEKEIGAVLKRLWRRRKDADYEDGAIIDIDKAKIAYQQAIKGLSKLTAIGAI